MWCERNRCGGIAPSGGVREVDAGAMACVGLMGNRSLDPVLAERNESPAVRGSRDGALALAWTGSYTMVVTCVYTRCAHVGQEAVGCRQ
jgi:hypothetical protein